jgi:selenocysteine-specific elongation factor
LHLGTAEVSARAVGAGGPVRPGERRAARLLLAEPIIARAGDRFVLRRPPPASTIGGGIVVDPLPPGRRARVWPLDDAAPSRRLELMLAEGGGYGVERDSLAIRLGLRGPDVNKLVEGNAGVLALGRRLYSRDQVAQVRTAILSSIQEHHRTHPLEDGAPIAELRGRLRASPELADHTLSELAASGEIELRGALVAETAWRPRLTAAQERTKRLLLEDIRSSGSEPPGVDALSERHQGDVMPLLRLLEKEGLVVAVEGDRFYSEESVRSLVDRLKGTMVPGREYSPTEMRDVLGVSRKFLIPFLEFCDRQRITERRTTGRVLHAP